MWLNEISDGMSMDIKSLKTEPWVTPKIRYGKTRRNWLKRASEGIGGDIGQYKVLESKWRECLNATENYKLLGIRRNEWLRRIMWSDLDFNSYQLNYTNFRIIHIDCCPLSCPLRWTIAPVEYY